MQNPYILTDAIHINASPDKIWHVLTHPDYIEQWDEMPEDYSGGALQLGSVIEWEGYSKLTVTEYNPNTRLKMDLFLPRVDLDASQYDVSYKYTLVPENGGTTLHFEIGDFSPLPKAQDYCDASLEFLAAAKPKIKALAEN